MIERRNPCNQAQTQCKNLVLPNIVILHHQTRTSSTLQSMRKTSTSTSQACRMRCWYHMASTFTTWFSRSRITLNDKHFKVILTTSSIQSLESKDPITAAGNTELCEIIDVEPKSQCRPCLTYWDVGIVYCTCGHFAGWYKRKQKVYLVRVGSLLYPELLHQERPTTRSQVREERRLQRIPHGKSTSKEVSKETIRKHSRSIYPWHVVQENDDRVGSLWRSHPWNGQTCKRRPQSYCQRRRTQRISWQLVDPFEFCRFRYDASKASTWLQEIIVDFASPQESRGQGALRKLVAKFLLMVQWKTTWWHPYFWDLTTKMDWTLIERGNLW